MEEKAYKKALNELKTISNKIELYVNNNATVPEKLSNDFAFSVIDVLDKFGEDMGEERLDQISSAIDSYYETLEEKVSADIGLLSPVKRKLLIQGYSAIRDKLKLYVDSNYTNKNLIDDIMNIENLLNKNCAAEFAKTGRYLKKDFDYSSYFFELRDSAIDTATQQYSVTINNLLTAASDADFYHYLELCVSSGTALDAIILLG